MNWASFTRKIPLFYCIWAVLAPAAAIAIGGLTAEHTTRILTLSFLLLQLIFQQRLSHSLAGLSPRARFLFFGTCFAAVVEGFHMISTPVFKALRFDSTTPPGEMLHRYLLDLAYTIPAYLVILSVLWFFINRYHYSLWQYVLTMGLAQTLGDGGIFYFMGAPWMLVFLPYPMSNYHAMNIIPFLAAREQLPQGRRLSWQRYLAIPAVVLTYLVCGSLIKIVGRSFGFE
jgi:hypothetical protein